jgi:hypothetical protein
LIPKAIDNFDVTNDTALDGLIAANSTVDQLIDRGKITWHQQGEQPSFRDRFNGPPDRHAEPLCARRCETSGNNDSRCSSSRRHAFIQFASFGRCWVPRQFSRRRRLWRRERRWRLGCWHRPMARRPRREL